MKKKQKGGQLKEMKISEVSIVDAPANKREFLFVKSDLEKAEADIQIKSDGTLKGTEITVNGKKIEDLKSFYFSFYEPADGEEAYIEPVSCSYTVTGNAEDGFITSETYDLSKAKGKTMDFKGLIDFVKELTGETLTKEQIEKWDPDIQKAWNTVSLYGSQFPPELHESLSKLMKAEAAVAVIEPVVLVPPAAEADGVVDKDKLASIETALKAVQDIITGTGEADLTTEAAVLKTVKEIGARLAKLETTEPPAPGPDAPATKTEAPPPDESGLAKVIAALEDIKTRMSVVEKSAGIEKGIKGDPGEAGEGGLWPSFKKDD